MAQQKGKARQTNVKKHKAARVSNAKKKVNWMFPLEKKNFIFVGIGLAVIILGYILMSTGITEEPAVPDGTWNNPMAVTVAPILLVIGYCVIIPLAIIKVFKKKEN